MSKLPKETIRAMITEGNLKTSGDLHSYLKDMFKDVLQEMLEAELEMELGYSKGDKNNKQTDNRRNGYSDKTVKTQYGEIPLKIPRDREGEFEPIVVPKNRRDISGIELSAEMVSKITDNLLPECFLQGEIPHFCKSFSQTAVGNYYVNRMSEFFIRSLSPLSIRR